jgi:hypothetical protein
MSTWLVIGLLACGGEPPSDPEPQDEPVEGVPDIVLPNGSTMSPRRGMGVHNSKPDHPVTRVMWKGLEGHELFIDGQNVGVLPHTTPLKVGPHKFEVLVGPGDRIEVEKHVVPKPGILLLELSR